MPDFKLSRRGTQNDEIHHEAGKQHANAGIHGGKTEFLFRPAGALLGMVAIGSFFFHVLAELPKEQIWRDGRSHNRYQHREMAAIKPKIRDECPTEDLRKIRLR